MSLWNRIWGGAMPLQGLARCTISHSTSANENMSPEGRRGPHKAVCRVCTCQLYREPLHQDMAVHMCRSSKVPVGKGSKRARQAGTCTWDAWAGKKPQQQPADNPSFCAHRPPLVWTGTVYASVPRTSVCDLAAWDHPLEVLRWDVCLHAGAAGGVCLAKMWGAGAPSGAKEMNLA